MAVKEVPICWGTLPLAGIISIDLRGEEVTTRSAGEALMPPSAALTCALPALNPVAKPNGVMVATPLSDEFQVTCVVRTCLVPFENVPVAPNGCVEAGASNAASGLIVIEISIALLTFRIADPVAPPKLALIVADPFATPLAIPVLVTVATRWFEDDHMTSKTKS
jgi:hypothetical protein